MILTERQRAALRKLDKHHHGWSIVGYCPYEQSPIVQTAHHQLKYLNERGRWVEYLGTLQKISV